MTEASRTSDTVASFFVSKEVDYDGTIHATYTSQEYDPWAAWG